MLLGALGRVASPTLPAHAAGIDTVTVCDESHLRGAITNAAAGDTVTFGCSGTITLTSTIALNQNVTIDGSGQSVTISGGGSVQVFSVSSNANVTLNLLTIANGNNPFIPNSFDGSGGAGGGIENNGTLTVSNSTLSGNHAGQAGGGIYNNGTLSVTNSTFSGNSLDPTYGTYGGGIYDNVGTVNVSNSTFSGNSAYAGGGGIAGNVGTVNVSNSTFSGNSVHAGGGGDNIAGTVHLVNTLLAAGNDGGGNCGVGNITDNGGNLADDNSCGFTHGGCIIIGGCEGIDTTFLDPYLGPLANNGGPTQTIKLLPGNPGIGMAACLQATDQRGYLRPGTGKAKCDSGAYESGAVAPSSVSLAKWYSDGGVDAGFLQQAGVALDSSLSGCVGLRSISGDFNGDGLADVLVYCPRTGAFQKLYGTRGIGPQFTIEPVQYVGNAPGAWTNIRMVAADFNGDGRTDVLVYRTDTGAYAKWFSDGGVDAGFTYEPTQYVGNAPGAWTNIQMVAADFNGDGRTDILAYRTDTGAYAKWFSDGGVDAGFQYQAVGYVGNAPSAWTNIQMVAADFNGDGKTDILVYRTDTGAYAKWFSDGGVDAGFTYEPTQYVGGAPSAWTNIQMVPADFNDDHVSDILVYRSDTGAFQKWYSPSGGAETATFLYEPTQYVGGASGAWTNVVLVPAHFSSPFTDMLVYRTDTGAYSKWYSDGSVGASFQYEPTQYVSNAPGAWTNLQMVPTDFNNDSRTDLLVYHT